MSLDRLPLLDRLHDSNGVLIAGCGGGFDVYCGLPLYFHLRNRGQKVWLANLSFSDLSQNGAAWDGAVSVDRESKGRAEYFPEKWLSEWAWTSRNEDLATLCVSASVGPKVLREHYAEFVSRQAIDTIVVVDGGTDTLMRGDESGLGTPTEDATTLAAVIDIPDVDRVLVCLGFGIDAHHGVCHRQVLEAAADLTKSGHSYGTLQLARGVPEVDAYVEACRFAAARNPIGPSIVQASICDALDGHYGNHHSTLRTRGSRLWINPLMTMYWGFDLDAVVRRNLYLDKIRDQSTARGVSLEIERFRSELGVIRSWEGIPI